MAMDDFWGGLVAQTLDQSEVIRPRLAGRFEPAPRMIAQREPASVESLEAEAQRDAATVTDAFPASQGSATTAFSINNEDAMRRAAANPVRFSPSATPAESGQRSGDLSSTQWNRIEDQLDEMNRLLDTQRAEQQQLARNMSERTARVTQSPVPQLSRNVPDDVPAAELSQRSKEQIVVQQPPVVTITRRIEEVVPAPAVRPTVAPAPAEPHSTQVKTTQAPIETPKRTAQIAREREAPMPLMPQASAHNARDARSAAPASAPRFNKQEMPASVPATAAAPATPTIQVTIGRVEVRAAPAPTAARKSVSAPQVMSLEEYLHQRQGGKHE
jgi:hypothetical protein